MLGREVSGLGFYLGAVEVCVCVCARVDRGGEIGCVRQWPLIRRVRVTVVVAGWESGHQGWAGKRRGIHPLTTKGVRWQCRGKKKVRGVGRSRDSNLSRRKWQRPAAAESRRAALQGTDSDCGGLSVEPRRPLSSFGELLRPVRTARLSFVSGLG